MCRIKPACSEVSTSPLKYRVWSSLATLRRQPHIGWHDAVMLSIMLAIGLLLWWGGYQGSYTTFIPIGGDIHTHRREYDAPFLQGVNAAEPEDPTDYRWWQLAPGYAYRWTKQHTTMQFDGVGGGHWRISIRALSGRPDGIPTTTTWQAGTRDLPTFSLSATPRTYHILAQASPNGDLRVTMHTPAYLTQDDPRELGFVLRGVHIAAVGEGLRIPALSQLGWLAAAMTIVYGLSRWLTLPMLWATALVGVLELGCTFLLATQRLTLTMFTPLLVGVLGASVPVALFLTFITQRLLRVPPIQPATHHITSTRPIVALVVLGFVLRLGGMLHPYAIFSDHRLHANNLLDVVGMGTIYFTEGLPTSAGGGKSPYPPGVYLVAAPAQLVVPETMAGRVLVVQSSVALLDSFMIGGVWLLLRQAGLGNKTALWGAALYLAPIPMMISFSIGEYTNIGGQALAMMPLLGLASGLLLPHTLGFAALLAMALLVHMGITISLVMTLVAWGVGEVWGVLRARSGQGAQLSYYTWQRVGAFVLAVLGAGVFVMLIYYASPHFRSIFTARLAGATTTNTPVSSEPIAAIVGDIARGLFDPRSQLVPVLVVCGMVGGVLLWHTHHPLPPCPTRYHRLGNLVHMITALWGGTLLSFGLLFLAQRGVRWQHFLYPALCLGAAPLLAAYAKRGRWGTTVAWTGVAVPVGYGVVAWVDHIARYLH